MDATKPYEFTGFVAMDVTKPYEFIGFVAMGRGREMGKRVARGRNPPPPSPPSQSFNVERAGGVAKGVASKPTVTVR